MTQSAEIIQFRRPDMEQESHAPDSGYIKLYRSLQESPFSGRPEYMSAWVHILMLASHKPRKTMLGNSIIELQSGQFVSGRKALAERVGISEKQMRSVLDFFEREGMLSKSSSRAGTVFTVCNYANFQDKKGQEGPAVLGQQKGQAKASNGAASSETGANEKANEGPTKRATTQEHKNISIPTGIDSYDSSGDEPHSKKPTPKKSTPDYPEEFEWIWQNRPRREGSDPKRKAFQACNARIKQGASWRDLAEGMKRYRRFCETKGLLNTEFTKTMAVFFGPDEHYRNDWVVNADQPAGRPTGAGKGPDWDDTSWAEDLGGL